MSTIMDALLQEAERKSVSYATIVGQILRRHRNTLDQSQKDFAVQSGLRSESGWSRIETGNIKLDVSRLRKIARTIGASPYQILKEADNVSARLNSLGIKVHEGQPQPEDINTNRIYIIIIVCKLENTME